MSIRIALPSTAVDLDFGPSPQVPIWREIRDAEDRPAARGYVTSRYAHAGRLIPGDHTILWGVGFPPGKSQNFFVGNDPVEVVLEE